ncbi:MAG: alpha-L-fucosidase [Prolixibacteraceae bacterium]|nr:alpha-L-fucosidase [Prolixibacteraceae bacterium]
MKITATILMLLFITVSCKKQETVYEATWESLEKVNPAPEWFKDAKFGIYFHWGTYSTPAYANEWYPRHMYQTGTREFEHHSQTYGHPNEWPYHYFVTGAKNKQGSFVQFAPKLKSEGGAFDPDEWADLFAKSGARFAGPVAEHHDGFSMWNSEVNPWNAQNYGAKTDLVKTLADAIRARNMKLILSMHHAYNFTGFYEHAPKYTEPELQLFYGQLPKNEAEKVWLDKHKEIIDKFKPDIIWQDFNLTALSKQVLLDFLAYYYNSAKKWNKEVVTTYKDALNTKVAMLDYERGGPKDIVDQYWLTDDALSNSSWCFTEGISYYTPKQVLHSFIDRVSKNGNLLLNISPRADGSIPLEQREILLCMGDWLSKYGEAIYNTRAWKVYGEGPTQMGSGHHHLEGGSFGDPIAGTAQDIRFTRSKDYKTLYAIMLGWPSNNTLELRSLAKNNLNKNSIKSAQLLIPNGNIELTFRFEESDSVFSFQLPEIITEEMAYVIKMELN